MTKILLIVEDDPLVSRMYQAAFKFEGFEIEVATNGMEGLEKLAKVKPNLILLDLMMPKMNGLELLDKIKTNPDYASIPVIVLTNLAGTEDARIALEKGAVKYIIKSQYKPRQIVNMVKEIMAASTRNAVPDTEEETPAS